MHPAVEVTVRIMASTCVRVARQARYRNSIRRLFRLNCGRIVIGIEDLEIKCYI